MHTYVVHKEDDVRAHANSDFDGHAYLTGVTAVEGEPPYTVAVPADALVELAAQLYELALRRADEEEIDVPFTGDVMRKLLTGDLSHG